MTRIHTDISRVPVSVAPNTATAGTSLGVTDANAAYLPDTYPFWAVLVPTGAAPTRANSEIVKVTSGSSGAGTTTYVIVRAQGVPATTAQSVTTSFDIYDANSSDTRLLINAVPTIDHSADGIYITLNANENQAFGDVCYIDTDGQAHLGDASVIATSSVQVMCVDESISANADGKYMVMGVARNDTWTWTVGGLIYLTITGTTGNTLSQTAPTATDEVVQIVGRATHADRMIFNPQLSQIELV